MKTLLKFLYLLPVAVVLGLLAGLVLNRSKPPPTRFLSGRPFLSAPITNLTASLFAAGNQLGPAENDLFIQFRDAGGDLVDVGDVQFELTLPAPDNILHKSWKALRTSTAGQYRVTVHPEIAGVWQAKLVINGPSASAEASFPVTVK
jgi:hypothetical protein